MFRTTDSEESFGPVFSCEGAWWDNLSLTRDSLAMSTTYVNPLRRGTNPKLDSFLAFFYIGLGMSESEVTLW